MIRVAAVTMAVILMPLPRAVLARNSYLGEFETIYGTTGTSAAGCNVCHTPSLNWNVYGQTLRSLGGGRPIAERLRSVESQDADGEGHSNLVEIVAGAQPGWCAPATAGCNNGGLTPPAGLSPLDPPAQPPNVPPTANAGGPYNATVGVPVTFSGAGSSDSDGSIVSYDWNFGNGTTGQGVSPNTTYASIGTYTVTLTVADNNGATDQASTSVTVSANQQPPVADAGGPYAGTVNVAIDFVGTGSRDPDGSIVSYAWDFGDGNTGAGATPVHSYGAGGTYTVSLTVTDNDGLTNTVTTRATVSDGTGLQPPAARAGGPYSGTTGLPVSFDGSRSSDPDGTIVSYDWNFGDGHTGSGVTLTHTYSAAGLYTVTLTVTDSTGLTDAATTTADVIDAVNHPPVADPGGPYTGEPGVPLAFDGTGSSDPDGSVTSYAWNFGDGTVDSGATPSHTYGAAGDYTVTLRVTDDSGTDSTPVTTLATVRSNAGGGAEYDARCAGCHGDPWAGNAVDPALTAQRRVAGARSCTIAAAISGNSVFPNGAPGMGSLVLSPAQIDSIAGYLNSREATGEQRYVTGCAGCHGNDGRGGRVDEGVRGAGAGDIREAIHDAQAMAYLACLPASDVESIAVFLGAGGGDPGEEPGHDDESSSGGAGSIGIGQLVGLTLLLVAGRKRRVVAEAYARYIGRTGLPASRSTPGNRGFLLLHRADGDRAEVMTVSLWDSLEAVKGFAGPDPERAVFYPLDASYLVDRDLHVDHWVVLAAPAPD
jgi:PKD repeat protein/heme-degrading monooxygenase HmoA